MKMMVMDEKSTLWADSVRYEMAYDLVNKCISGNDSDNREALRYLQRLKQDTYLAIEKMEKDSNDPL